jgi:hypothetical protein
MCSPRRCGQCYLLRYPGLTAISRPDYPWCSDGAGLQTGELSTPGRAEQRREPDGLATGIIDGGCRPRWNGWRVLQFARDASRPTSDR